MKIILLISLILASTSSMAASFSRRNQIVSDREMQVKLCRTQGVYSYALEAEATERAQCDDLEYKLVGVTHADHGETTIKHYEIAKPMHPPCQVIEYFVPGGRYVVLEDTGSYPVGEIAMRKSSWKRKALLPEQSGACFY